MTGFPLTFPVATPRARMLVASGMVVCACPTLAVDPAYRLIGPVHIEPTLRAEVSHEDNIFRTRNNTKDSVILTTIPRLRSWLQDGYNYYGGGFEIIDYEFRDSDDDDFTDRRAFLDMHHEFDVKNSLDIDGEYFWTHERRGTGLTEGDLSQLIDEPVKYDLAALGGVYTLGNNESAGRLELGYRYEDYHYKNFRDATRFRDREADLARATFYYNVAPRTDALVELRYENQDYVNTPNDRPSWDSDEISYLVGVTWAATGKTTGTVKVGGYEREFDDSRYGQSDGFRWDAIVDYYRKSYSSLQFRTGQYSQEANFEGSFVETQEYQVGWNHGWNGITKSDLSVLYAEDDYEDFDRKDDRTEVQFRITRSLDRWLDVGAGYRYEERDSDIRAFEYDLNVFFVDIELSL